MATGYGLSRRIVFGGLFFVLLVYMGGCATIGTWVSKKIYPSLNTPVDGEPPPTFVNVLPSAQLSAWIGGQGGGLNCSIPTLVKPAFFHAIDDGSDVNLRFRQACAMHDLCYRHGSATYGYSQVDCDFALLESAFRICSLVYLNNAEPGKSEKKAAETLSEEARSDAITTCRDQAQQVLLGVRLGGGGSFKAKEASSYFEFDPMPDRAVDYTTVRWLDGPTTASNGPRFLFYRVLYGHGRSETFPSSGSAILPTHFGFAPAPPSIVSGTQGDYLISITKATRINTELGIWNIDPTQTSPGKKDPNSSVVWMDTSSPTSLVFWKRTPLSSTEARPFIGSCLASGECKAKDWSYASVNGTLHDSYRTLQNPPLGGYFFSKDCKNYVVFRRGGDPSASSLTTHDRGDGFETKLGLMFGSDPTMHKNPVCENIAPKVVDIAETYEPLGVIELGELDALIGFAAVDPAKPALPFSARIFRLKDGMSKTEMTFLDPRTNKPLGAEWLRRSVSITRKNLLHDGHPHITLTRVSQRPFKGVSSTHLEALDYPIDPKICMSSSCSPPATAGIVCDFFEEEELKDRGTNYIRWSNAPAFSGLFPVGTRSGPSTKAVQVAVFKSGRDWKTVILTLPVFNDLGENKLTNPAYAHLDKESRVKCTDFLSRR